MGVFSRDVQRVLLGVGIGAGTFAIAPIAGATVAAVTRPLVKALLKHSILAAERGRERLMVLTESLEDIVAEVRAEVEDELGRDRGARPMTEGSGGRAAGANGAESREERPS